MIFWYKPPPCFGTNHLPANFYRITRGNPDCLEIRYKRCETWSRIFCAYLRGMYDFTRVIRSIVCMEVDLC